MHKIHAHFRDADPVLYAYINRIGELETIRKDKPANYFYRLCRDIIGQQLSEKAGDTIIARFHALYSAAIPSPEDVITTPHDKLRGAGMSHAKANYMHNLARAVRNKTVRLTILDTMPDNEVITELTKVKGIGPWTAEMFLIFVLGREDVFSHGDLGLRKGIKKIYGFKKDPTKKQVEKIVSRWSPHKSYASRILWKSLEL